MSIFNMYELLDMNPDESIKKMNKIYNRLCVISVFLVVFVIIAILMEATFKYESKIIIEIIKLVLGCVAIFSLYISFMNHCLARKHKQTSIEMEKKNKAIEMLYKWSLENNTEVLIARKITEHLDDENVAKLSDACEAITVSLKDYEMMHPFLPKIKTSETDDISSNEQRNCNDQAKKDDIGEEKRCTECPLSDRKRLTMGETLWLRSNVLKYLNVLEVIMYAWSADIVARDVIEMEFGYLVTRERNGSVVLEKFRKQQGQENYPGIYAFCNEMSKKNEKKIIQQSYKG